MDEAQKLTRLVRALSMFVFVPTSTIGGALALYSWEAHELHAGSFAILAVASLVVFWRAPRIAARFAPAETANANA